MQTGILTIQKLFGQEVHYAVPLYQRPYVWNEADQWQPLWDDLRPLAELVAKGQEGRAHFLGASVQEVIPVPAGTTQVRRIIDGQQRMTTLQLILKAFHDVAAARGFDRYAAAVDALLSNRDPLITEIAKRHKVWPTRADQADYQAVMDTTQPTTLKESLGQAGAKYPLPNHTIANAYRFFFREIDDWLPTDNAEAEQLIQGLYGGISDRLRLVVIDLDDKDDAQAIFETLNARGAPLLSADLVKNSLLGELAPKEAEDAYRRYWQSFDDDSDFWRHLTGRGHAQRARIETFLQHALTLMTGEIVSAGHLYNAFRDHAATDAAGSTIDLLKRFKRLGDIYYRLQKPQADSRIVAFYDRLTVLDVTTAWPFILALYEKHESDTAVIKAVLLDLESYLIRRMVCRLSSRGYGAVFTHLAAVVTKSKTDIIASIRNELLDGDAEIDRFPSDDEFERALQHYPLYQNLTRPRIRLLLEALEEATRSHFAEEGTCKKQLTVEHVMPQEWRQNWPLANDALEDERDRIVHTIGNLTLLNSKFNSYQSNRPWIAPAGSDSPGKRDKLKEHTVLAMNRELCDHDEWGETQIQERATVLADRAKAVWPRPIK